MTIYLPDSLAAEVDAKLAITTSRRSARTRSAMSWTGWKPAPRSRPRALSA
jgi:hypothetical protein